MFICLIYMATPYGRYIYSACLPWTLLIVAVAFFWGGGQGSAIVIFTIDIEYVHQLMREVH